MSYKTIAKSKLSNLSNKTIESMYHKIGDTQMNNKICNNCCKFVDYENINKETLTLTKDGIWFKHECGNSLLILRKEYNNQNKFVVSYMNDNLKSD